MPGATTMRTTIRPRLAPWGVALLLATTAGCELIVNTDTGLGPPGCALDAPDFANRCTTAAVIPFDNCARLHACDSAALAAAMQLSAPPPPPQAAPPPATQPMPSVNCAD